MNGRQAERRDERPTTEQEDSQRGERDNQYQFFTSVSVWLRLPEGSERAIAAHF